MCQQRSDEWLLSAVRREFVLRFGHSLCDFALFRFDFFLFRGSLALCAVCRLNESFSARRRSASAHKFHTFIGWLVFNTFHNSPEISFPDWANAFFPQAIEKKTRFRAMRRRICLFLAFRRDRKRSKEYQPFDPLICTEPRWSRPSHSQFSRTSPSNSQCYRAKIRCPRW